MPNQPVRRVVRGTLTQWNTLFRGAGRHSDLVTVRRRSQGNAAGREEKLVAIGSQISPSVLIGLMLCALQSFIHFPCLACLSTSCCSFHPQPVHLTFRVATMPERNSDAQGQAKDYSYWDEIGQAGGEQDPSNRSTSSGRIKACNQRCVKHHVLLQLSPSMSLLLWRLETGQWKAQLAFHLIMQHLTGLFSGRVARHKWAKSSVCFKKLLL